MISQNEVHEIDKSWTCSCNFGSKQSAISLHTPDDNSNDMSVNLKDRRKHRGIRNLHFTRAELETEVAGRHAVHGLMEPTTTLRNIKNPGIRQCARDSNVNEVEMVKSSADTYVAVLMRTKQKIRVRLDGCWGYTSRMCLAISKACFYD